jgi:diadenosine tetraphosphate (Ap4A) HIT family hydrolase
MSCPFCAVRADRIIAESEAAIAILDAYPVSEGHTLVLPRRHVRTIYDLSAPDQTGLWQLVGQVRAKLLEQYRPEGFNVGFNDGLSAGQTIAHAHIQFIPRRAGDVLDPRGGIRWVIAKNAPYWEKD